MSLESAVDTMENKLRMTTNELDDLLWKIETFEEYMKEPNQVPTLKMIQQVATLKEKYEKLEQTVTSLKNIQKELHGVLSENLRNIHRHETILHDIILNILDQNNL